MPPRNPELPEGTDHIINGAMDTSGETGMTGAGGTSSGFVGSGADDDTGGMSGGIGGGMSSSSFGSTTGGAGTSSLGGTPGGSGLSTGSDFGSTGGGADIKTQLRDGASSMQQQAGDKLRSYAETGKTRATSALDDFSQVVNDAAISIDERLGSEYGEYARRAADAVSGLADNLRTRQVDQLFDDGRNMVRKSPGIAIGAAAVVGFTLIRLIKSGMDSKKNEREIEFEPAADLGAPRTVSDYGTATTPTSGL